ncbi:ABC transporter ATP-binding protein [Jatrophihabitans telluris]|uniref:ABC transporter ATP-binding protein n=1 Tax=Jatrophihabitans telluris TaxID=2038343 RepID=A0ABY4QVA4_9ACTN|nr:ABC transporter ATP-binding protein [Jatrophihabitans telluris]UQX86910.1 ABC transporter ATP-binding protein [Jatrophihabitans telluris]
MTTVAGPRAGIEVRCLNVGRTYSVDGEDVHALTDVSIRIAGGESVSLFGPSGSGKSTLTALLAGLRRPSSGQIWVGEEELSGMSERELLRLRGREIGIVLQNPSRTLLPYGTAEDNIAFARRSTRRSERGRLEDSHTLLRQLDLTELAGQRVASLSGGEQQRLSIAVAMSRGPGLLLADEPTSQLDSANRDRAVQVFGRIATEFGTTIVTVTHDPVVADATHRRITLSEGRVVDDGLSWHAGRR